MKPTASLLTSRRPDIVVEVRNVPAAHADRVDSLIARFAEPHPLPVLTADAGRCFVFRFQPAPRDEAEPFFEMASPTHMAGGTMTIRAVDGFLPADAGCARHELAPLSQFDAGRLIADFGCYLSDVEPPAPVVKWKAPPLRSPGKPLLYGNSYAQFVIHSNGLMPATPSGAVPPRAGIQFNADTRDELASEPMAVAVVARERSLAVVELDWSVPETAATAYAAAGIAPRGAEVAASIEAIIARHTGSGVIAAKREETRVTLVFANADHGPFADQYNLRRAPKRDDGMEVPNASVAIKCRTQGAPLDISAADAWSIDLADTKRGEMASLASNQFVDALAEIEGWLKAGADLDKPVPVDEPQTEAIEPATRRRKSAAA